VNSIESLLRWSMLLFGVRFVFSLPVSFLLRSPTRAFVIPFVLMLWGYAYWILGVLGSPLLVRDTVSLTLVLAYFFFLERSSRVELKKYRLAFSEEFIFWGVFFLAVFIRSRCSAWTGSEKFPDLLIFQSTVLDQVYPPIDRWMPPFQLNYYYLSYVLFVPAFKLSGVPIEYFVNLVIPTILAILASVSFGFVWELTGSRAFSVLSAFYAALAGNWEWIKQAHDRLFANYFSWWNSSRAIPFTITEFPYFSFLLGDFHPHYNSLPWFMLSLWIILQKRAWSHVFLVGLAIGIHYPMNAWQLPILALICALVHWKKPAQLATIGVLSYLLFLPFWRDYQKPVSGIYYVVAKSGGLEFLYHWAPFLLPMALLFASPLQKKNWWKYALVAGTFVLGQAVGIICFCAFVFKKIIREETKIEAGLVYLSLALMLFCEFFSLDPSYGEKYLRMNTVFKFYMLVWAMLAVAVPSLMYRQKKHRVFVALFTLLCLVYPIKGTIARWKDSGLSSSTLDGLFYWDQKFPHEREAMEWIRKNTNSNDTLLEANGEAYQEFGRYSTFTGRANILGWFNHEQVWRKNGFLLASDRQKDMEFFRISSSPAVWRNILDNYRVRWVVVGKLERERFHADALAWFSTFPRVFHNAGASIYAIPQPPDPQ